MGGPGMVPDPLTGGGRSHMKPLDASPCHRLTKTSPVLGGEPWVTTAPRHGPFMCPSSRCPRGLRDHVREGVREGPLLRRDQTTPGPRSGVDQNRLAWTALHFSLPKTGLEKDGPFPRRAVCPTGHLIWRPHTWRPPASHYRHGRGWDESSSPGTFYRGRVVPGGNRKHGGLTGSLSR